MDRTFTRAELDALARPPREQFAAALEEGADVSLSTFIRLERHYHGFIDGFHDWIATIQAFLYERHGVPGLAGASHLDAALSSSLRAGFDQQDLDRSASSQREAIEELLRGGSRAAALALFERVETSLRRRHDVIRDTLSSLLSYVYRNHGVEELEACFRYSGERTLLRWMPVDVARPVEQRLRQWAALSLGNFSRIHIEEDDEKFTITQDPCGSCTRQICDGAYSPPLDLAVVGERHALTFGKGGAPVYRTHVAVMHYLMPIERTGAPWPVVLCPDGLGTGPCRILLYKDPKRTPAQYAERVKRSS